MVYVFIMIYGYQICLLIYYKVSDNHFRCTEIIQLAKKRVTRNQVGNAQPNSSITIIIFYEGS